jgi:hypothetical protein
MSPFQVRKSRARMSCGGCFLRTSLDRPAIVASFSEKPVPGVFLPSSSVPGIKKNSLPVGSCEVILQVGGTGLPSKLPTNPPSTQAE